MGHNLKHKSLGSLEPQGGLYFSKISEFINYFQTPSKKKKAAKRTRQHAGKKYRKAEYVQRCVYFVNEQVSNINGKFSTSQLCMKKSSFLLVLAWVMPRILYLSCVVPFPVWTPDNISFLLSVVPWLLR